MAAVAGLALTLSAFLESFRATHVGALFLLLIALHLVWHSRFTWRREYALYAYFVGYMVVSLLWTHDIELAMNTLAPAVNCILVMIFFGSLMSFHNVPTALSGTLFGFVVCAALYTITQGFPFSYPEEFSYNAIAGMYLFGLFITLMYSCFRRSNSLVLTGLAVVIMAHIVATTSIKTNLGIALGLVAAAIMYLRHFGRLLLRRIIVLIILAGGLGFTIASNDALVDQMDRGVQRVLVGVQVLQSREDVAGYSAFAERDYWKRAGIDGWKQNPIFGYGTEAFRDDYGITSHSTPIDLLYDHGLIGLVLFYSVFASLMWRLLQLEHRRFTGQRSLIFAGVVCYVFVSLSGTVHYNSFLAAFIGISSALLARYSVSRASTLAASK
jgi:O-antigen ligase